MNDLVSRDVEYRHDDTRMVGLLCAPEAAPARPGILLVHDAFGLSPDMIDVAHRLAGLGFAVFAADVWGDRTQPATQPEIGPLIGGMVADRPRWMARIAAAHDAARAQPEIDASAIAVLGYCFGGSSALEYVRTGGDVLGAVSIHGGLDLLHPDWSAPRRTAQVLVCTGADDPMATAPMRAELETSLSSVGIDWEVALYSDTVHAFTSLRSRHSPTPHVVAYNARSAARAWDSTTRFLRDLFPDVRPVAP